jgi:uncharacterized SAM-dependent methyltransferase
VADPVVVRPSRAFYELYGPRQIEAILTSLEEHRELPRQYGYFGRGSEHWDRYTRRLWHEPGDNAPVLSARLLRSCQGIIDEHVSGSDEVDVLDLGVGNGLPVRATLAHLVDLGLGVHYVGIDLSATMLELAESNLRAWFGDRLTFTGHLQDLADPSLGALIRRERTPHRPGIALLLGGTLSNLRSPETTLRAIKNGLGGRGKNILALSTKLDSPESRTYFDFSATGQTGTGLDDQDRFVLDLLNISAHHYVARNRFDESRLMRSISARLTDPVRLVVDVKGHEHSLSFAAGEEIVVWHFRHQDLLGVEDQLTDAGFAMIRSFLPEEETYVLAVAAPV